ncbi:hypothetical protein BT69DRAFT_1349114, partial [Atractiella rhizophila]
MATTDQTPSQTPTPTVAVSHENWDLDADFVLPSGPLDLNPKALYNLDPSSFSSRSDSIFSHLGRESSLEPLSSDEGRPTLSNVKESWDEEDEDWAAEMGLEGGDGNESGDSSKGDTIRAKFGLGDFKSPEKKVAESGKGDELGGAGVTVNVSEGESEVKENTIKGLPVDFPRKEKLLPKLSSGSSAIEADDEDFESSFDLPIS